MNEYTYCKGVGKRKERLKRQSIYLKRKAKNFPTLGKYIAICIHEVHRFPRKIRPKEKNPDTS
jgi:hypothetical protein